MYKNLERKINMIIAKINNVVQNRCGLQSQENHNPIYSNLKSLKQDTVSFGSAVSEIISISTEHARKLAEIATYLQTLSPNSSARRQLGEVSYNQAGRSIQFIFADKLNLMIALEQKEGKITGLRLISRVNDSSAQFDQLHGIVSANRGYSEFSPISTGTYCEELSKTLARLLKVNLSQA